MMVSRYASVSSSVVRKASVAKAAGRFVVVRVGSLSGLILLIEVDIVLEKRRIAGAIVGDLATIAVQGIFLEHQIIVLGDESIESLITVIAGWDDEQRTRMLPVSHTLSDINRTIVMVSLRVDEHRS